MHSSSRSFNLTGRSDELFLGCFKKGHHLFPLHRGKPFEKIVNRIAALQIIDQSLDGNPGAGEAWSAAHDPSVNRDDLPFHRSNFGESGLISSGEPSPSHPVTATIQGRRFRKGFITSNRQKDYSNSFNSSRVRPACLRISCNVPRAIFSAHRNNSAPVAGGIRFLHGNMTSLLPEHDKAGFAESEIRAGDVRQPAHTATSTFASSGSPTDSSSSSAPHVSI
jgi:hypothetical protein